MKLKTSVQPWRAKVSRDQSIKLLSAPNKPSTHTYTPELSGKGHQFPKVWFTVYSVMEMKMNTWSRYIWMALNNMRKETAVHIHCIRTIFSIIFTRSLAP